MTGFLHGMACKDSQAATIRARRDIPNLIACEHARLYTRTSAGAIEAEG